MGKIYWSIWFSQKHEKLSCLLLKCMLLVINFSVPRHWWHWFFHHWLGHGAEQLSSHSSHLLLTNCNLVIFLVSFPHLVTKLHTCAVFSWWHFEKITDVHSLYQLYFTQEQKKKKRGVVVWGLDRREQQDPIQGVCKTMPSNLVAVTWF